MIRCIFCGYCEEACPTQAIQLKDICELADDNAQRFDLHQRNDARPRPDDSRSGYRLFYDTHNSSFSRILAAITVVCGIAMILQENPVRSALFLVLVLFSVALLFLAARRLYRRGADHCLCRGDHGAVYLRHHAAESGDA